MSKKPTLPAAPEPEGENPFLKALRDLVSQIPDSSEPAGADPTTRCRALANSAALKAAALSGTLALPPGPAGLVTILPDLLAIWHIQRQLVADIAAAHGKTSFLTLESMMYCLFKHGAAQALRDVVVRMGQRLLIRRASLRVIQSVLKKVGVSITQRLASKAIARWLPIVGAIGIGAYAYYDTAQVAKTAVGLFSQKLDIEPERS